MERASAGPYAIAISALRRIAPMALSAVAALSLVTATSAPSRAAAAAPPPHSQPQSTQSPDAVDEIVVSGEQPGPGLWKVTKGDHVLWILGTLTPLPKRMTWRSGEIE